MVNVKPTQLGKNVRMSFSKINEVLEMPNLIEIQKNSYKWFLTEGLKEVFADSSAISDYTGNLVLDFVDYRLDEEPKYSVTECKERDATYAAPLRVTARLHNKVTGEVKQQEIFMGDFPIMTDSGTFVINGAERVIVSQLVRSPGAYFGMEHDKTGKELFNSTIIPNRGAWLEYETDSNDVFYVRIDKNRKIPVTVFLRALGLGSNEEILTMFGEEQKLYATFEKDNTDDVETGLLEVYRKLRPGEPPTVESAQTHIDNLFFDPRRYDLSKVGRYKYNKKLALKDRIRGHKLAEAAVNPLTGEIILEPGVTVTAEKAIEIFESGIDTVYLMMEDGKTVKVFSNGMVDANKFVNFDVAECGIKELVSFAVLQEIMSECATEEELREALNARRAELIPGHITLDDIFASVNYILCLSHGIGSTDDIDHLGNRRIRSVGELLQNQVRIGFSRMERVIRERMTLQAGEIEAVTPQALINIRPVVAAIKEFFGSSPLSQFMDQNNPLAELTHKRRLSALGPGGLSRDRAGFEVRDVHYTHYGRMCPIETPEGPNIGLISYLASFARINEYGFIEAPYRKVDKETGVVSEEVVYMTADIEDNYVVAQANEPLDENGRFKNKRINARYRDE
ncbi:MAG: DNA-directed RNA polymerase subunit beta, partial [Oscillospiraceae bacterium]|nr:DNA-directed RNA polymerase subunit beta [Oscillospiraceae bacterium]